MSNLYVYTDGGARGNPGPAAIGVYIKNEEKDLAAIGKTIGRQTNNIAEYRAIIEALNWLLENKENIDKNAKINFFVDSQLAYSQIVGLYKVKNDNIRTLLFKIREIEAELKMQIIYKHIPREENKKADSLVNLALNKKL